MPNTSEGQVRIENCEEQKTQITNEEPQSEEKGNQSAKASNRVLHETKRLRRVSAVGERQETEIPNNGDGSQRRRRYQKSP